MIGGTLPAGYVRVTAGRCLAVVREEYADDARALLAEGTLYQAAARDLAARPLQGRGVAYAIALPVSRERVVVRHNRHGGLLRGLTRDIFLAPSRAPYELDMARRLADAGVPTPAVVMYGLVRVARMFCRADVATREIVGGRDLASHMAPHEFASARDEAWGAARTLLHALNAAGARHHDLNVKNVLLVRERGVLLAYALDVDRVAFGPPHSQAVREQNTQRLRRSARKWRDERGAVFDETHLPD